MTKRMKRSEYIEWAKRCGPGVTVQIICDELAEAHADLAEKAGVEWLPEKRERLPPVRIHHQWGLVVIEEGKVSHQVRKLTAQEYREVAAITNATGDLIELLETKIAVEDELPGVASALLATLRFLDRRLKAHLELQP